VAEAKPLAEAKEEARAGEEPPAEVLPILEPVLAPEQAAEEVAKVEEAEEEIEPLPVSFEPDGTAEEPQIRFAEDILVSAPPKPEAKPKKRKRKGTQVRESAEDGIRLRKSRRESEVPLDDEEY